MIDRRRAFRLFGESLREIGILILVFGPLDAFFEREPAGGVPLATMVVGGLLLIAAGIMIDAEV